MIKHTARALPQAKRRRFSLEQANRSLVLVGRIVSDVVNEHMRMLELLQLLEHHQSCGHEHQLMQTRNQLHRSIERFKRFLEEIDELGVLLVDWTKGIVEFPSFDGDREICLVWQLGRQEVSSWCQIGDEYQPIETLTCSGK